MAKTIVEIAASPSGITATAKLTAVINISSGSFPCNSPIIKITTQIASEAIPRVFPNLFNLRCKGVSDFSVLFKIPAILPTSVFIPVSTTIPFPLPYVIKLEENTMLVLSPIPTSSLLIVVTYLSTGTDSPVSDVSCALKFTASVILISAGT